MDNNTPPKDKSPLKQTPHAERLSSPTSQEWRSNLQKETKELFPIPPKKLLPVATKELFPVSTRELRPHERAKELMPTPKKELSPAPSKELFPTRIIADSKRLGVNQAIELFPKIWLKPQPREGDRGRNPTGRYNPLPNDRKNVLPRNQSSESVEKWKHDLFERSELSAKSAPYFEREKNSCPQRSTESPLPPQPSPQFATKSGSTSQPSSTLLEARSLGNTMEPSLQVKLKTIVAATSMQVKMANEKWELSTFGTMKQDTRRENKQPERDHVSSPSPNRYTLPEPTALSKWFDFTTPDPEPQSSTKFTTSKTPSAASSPYEPKSKPRKRPETTDLVARRLIGSALGMRIPERSDDRSAEITKVMREKRVGTGNGNMRILEENTKGLPSKPEKDDGNGAGSGW